MGLKYVEDPGDWFSFTLKDGVRQQCCGCGLTHDIYVRRKERGLERATAAARRAREKSVVSADA
jgi:hypothetical protein